MVVIDGPDNFPEWERRQNEAALRDEAYSEAAAELREVAEALRDAVAPLRRCLQMAEATQYAHEITQKDAGLGAFNFEEIRQIVEDLFKGDDE